MSVHLHLKTGSYFVRYRDESGKQCQKSFPGPEGKNEAEAFDQNIKLLKSGEELTSTPNKQKALYFDELGTGLVYFEESSRAVQSGSLNSLPIMNNNVIEKLSRVPVKELQQKEIVNLIYELTEKNSPTTRNRYLIYLKCIFNWGVEQEYIEKNPLAKWKKGQRKQNENQYLHSPCC